MYKLLVHHVHRVMCGYVDCRLR